MMVGHCKLFRKCKGSATPEAFDKSTCSELDSSSTGMLSLLLALLGLIPNLGDLLNFLTKNQSDPHIIMVLVHNITDMSSS